MSVLNTRVQKLEAKANPAASLVSVVRIVADDDADADRQIADEIARGDLNQDTLFIVRLVVPSPRTAA